MSRCGTATIFRWAAISTYPRRSRVGWPIRHRLARPGRLRCWLIEPAFTCCKARSSSMFDFLRKPGMHSPSAFLLRTLERARLPAGTNPAALGVVETEGSYAGHAVTYFRVFDPKRAAARAVNVFTRDTYDDLNAHLDL